ETRRVQVVHLRLGDLLHRGAADLPDLLLVRLARALLDASLFADEVGGGRRLRDEAVGAVLEDRHDRGHDGARERGGPLVVLLDELTHVDAVRAERGADRRRRRRLPRGDLDLDDCFDFLGHYFTSFSICRKSSSTGVSRPKMETRDRKSTRLNSSHVAISYAVFCLKKK